MTGVEIGKRIDSPRTAVEVTGEEGAGVVAQQWVDSNRCITVEVVGQYGVGKRQVLLLRPLVRPSASDRRRPPRLPARLVLPSEGEHVGTSAEQRPQERQLALQRRG